jgi:hypothetical protein
VSKSMHAEQGEPSPHNHHLQQFMRLCCRGKRGVTFADLHRARAKWVARQRGVLSEVRHPLSRQGVAVFPLV